MALVLILMCTGERSGSLVVATGPIGEVRLSEGRLQSAASRAQRCGDRRSVRGGRRIRKYSYILHYTHTQHLLPFSQICCLYAIIILDIDTLLSLVCRRRRDFTHMTTIAL